MYVMFFGSDATALYFCDMFFLVYLLEECFSLKNNISILKRQFVETGRERDRLQLVEELKRKNRVRK